MTFCYLIFFQPIQDIAIDVGGTVSKIHNIFYPESDSDSDLWRKCFGKLDFSISLKDGATWSVTEDLDDTVSVTISVTVEDSTWYEDACAFLKKCGKPLGAGAVSEGCGKNAVYSGGGAVYANVGGGLGGGSRGFNTMTFMCM